MMYPGSLRRLLDSTAFYRRQLTAIEELTDWCRENATKPPPAHLLYAAAGSVENLRDRLAVTKEPAT